ncbi:centrosomal protein 43 isoform X2 [Denticeps clupeoides]|uniref:centrosomal protein 43 isoform X2 n=1 Tax=Denticeps clupeoides TaxID=299321 RepID=UPI0010A53578|nr:FGFR1 oncogene partner isoform X2 [Denticeps clupeoides]
MSAADEDTELRDLLIQNLENNGVLNKIKAELRAAVFVALEEQDKIENKSQLVNENLKKCLNTKDGRLAASLISDFLQFFHLDFTLAVFQPEINTLNGFDSHDALSRDLGMSDAEGNRNNPLLLELIRCSRNKDKPMPLFTEGEYAANIPKIAEAKKKFDVHNKDKNGRISKDEVTAVVADMFPNFSSRPLIPPQKNLKRRWDNNPTCLHGRCTRTMVEAYITDELKDKDLSTTVDFQEFLGIYKRLFLQCRSVVTANVVEAAQNVLNQKDEKEKSDTTLLIKKSSSGMGDHQASSSLRKPGDLEVDEVEDGDSFFDDPLPKPQKSYGWKGTMSHADSVLVKIQVPLISPSNRELSGSRNDEDLDYDYDFNSHRSENSKSEVSIGEEIEEISIEGPELSEKLDIITQDLSMSQLSQGVDYLEEVS